MAVLRLTPVLDGSAAAPLQTLLLAHRGQDVELDAGAVVRIGAQCLQVLLAATRTWQADGCLMRIRSLSDRCRDALTVTGATRLVGAEE
jgi:chemotaxis protein CheX